jgi:hypothetical protein
MTALALAPDGLCDTLKFSTCGPHSTNQTPTFPPHLQRPLGSHGSVRFALRLTLELQLIYYSGRNIARNRIDAKKDAKAAKKPQNKPDPPTVLNNYATRKYDFSNPMKMPKDWKAGDKTWCEFHGPCKHTTDKCTQAIDDAAIKRGEVPPGPGLKKEAIEKKRAARKEEIEELGAARRRAVADIKHQFKQLDSFIGK